MLIQNELRENEKNEAVASFVDLWNELASEETTTADVRWQKLSDAALATLNILRWGWFRLLDAVGRENPDVYQLVADALDQFNECPAPFRATRLLRAHEYT
jgi:hypothetical protein